MQATPRDGNEAANSSDSSSDVSTGTHTSGGAGSNGVSASDVQNAEHRVLPTEVLKGRGGNVSSVCGEQVSCDAKDLSTLDARQSSPQRTEQTAYVAESLGSGIKSDSAPSVRQSPSPPIEEKNVVADRTASCGSETLAPKLPKGDSSDVPKSSQTASPAVKNRLANDTVAYETSALSSKQSSQTMRTKGVVTPQEQSPIPVVSESITTKNIIQNDSVPATTNHAPSFNIKPRPRNRMDCIQDTSTFGTTSALAPNSDQVQSSRNNFTTESEGQPTAQRSSTAPKRSSFLVSSAPKSPQTYGRPRSNSVPNSPTASLLIAAASSSSSATGPVQAPKLSPQNKTNMPLRRGKWTVEEEAYVARVIQEFNSGFLNAPAGTTLRTYLSEKLHCDPMRITKKFTGDSCIGKRVFHPAVRCANNAAAIDKAQAELDSLERRWRRRLEMQQKESAKKAAASVAAAAAASTSRHHAPANATNLQPSIVPSTREHKPIKTTVASIEPPKENAIAQTASWLDRAQALLSGKPGTACLPTSDHQQMKEVKRLIDEAPTVHHSMSPPCASESFTACKRKVSVEDQEGPPPRPPSSLVPARSTPPSVPQQAIQPPGALYQHHRHNSSQSTASGCSAGRQMAGNGNDKRPRRSQSANVLSSLSSSDAAASKDAEALVGFLNTVRAAAAASSSADGSIG